MGQFALEISAFAKKAGDNANLVIRKVAIDMYSRVIQRSPVDTGRFRGNWQLTVGKEPTGNVDRTDKTGSATVAEGTKAVAKFEAGPDIFIVNNLPYGSRLEYEGWSKQAPAGMVRITVAEYQGLIAKAVGETKS